MVNARRRIFPGLGVVFIFCAGLLAPMLMAHAGDPPRWEVEAGGLLTFTATYGDDRISGHFKDWTAMIALDPAAPQGAEIAVEIALDSVTTGSSQRDRILKGVDFFAVDRWPQAHFYSQDVRFRPEPSSETSESSAETYEARGSLTIRDISQVVVLPFRLRAVAPGVLRAQGAAVLSRRAFGVGGGEWLESDKLADAVELSFDLRARRQD